MLLYAHGLPKSKIAKMLCKEVSTIETHIDNIRNKSSLTDRFSMLMYLKDRGEDIAINFFSLTLKVAINNTGTSLINIGLR